MALSPEYLPAMAFGLVVSLDNQCASMYSVVQVETDCDDDAKVSSP
jgi:hypothetical protein